jgi:hypothetical protein
MQEHPPGSQDRGRDRHGQPSVQRSVSPSSTTISNVTSEGCAPSARKGDAAPQKALPSESLAVNAPTATTRQGGFTLSHAAQVLRPDVLRNTNGSASGVAGAGQRQGSSAPARHAGEEELHLKGETGLYERSGSRTSSLPRKASSNDRRSAMAFAAVQAWQAPPSHPQPSFPGSLTAALSASGNAVQADARAAADSLPVMSPQQLAMFVSQVCVHSLAARRCLCLVAPCPGVPHPPPPCSPTICLRCFILAGSASYDVLPPGHVPCAVAR